MKKVLRRAMYGTIGAAIGAAITLLWLSFEIAAGNFLIVSFVFFAVSIAESIHISK